ncbi:MAG: LD-carboxypeptidase [Clostridia bacterium]|nr:LD-carboxypeptidase [Clostridia bacterium]
MIKYPDKLKENDVIGIAAVSDGANLKKIDSSISNFNHLGFKVVETENVRNSNKFVSTSGKARAQEFMQLWQNKDVKYIISARGGEFLMEMLPYLDEYSNLIRITNPIKWVQGYSDPSLLLFYLTTKYNIATIHGENVGEFAMELDHFHDGLKNIISFLKSNDREFVQNSYDKYQLEEFEEGNMSGYNLTEKVEYKLFGSMDKEISVEGRMIGGCIEAITPIIGTKFDHCQKFCCQFDEGMIWYLDNYELNAVKFYIKLWQMRQAGWFDNVNAFLIGRTFGGASLGEFTYLDALRNALYDLNVPIIYDADIGHVSPQISVINGSYGKIEYNNGKMKLIQKMI